MEFWLENRVKEVDHVICCDYEEDIFERNIKEGKSKFPDVKLYSANFSFSRIKSPFSVNKILTDTVSIKAG